MSARKTQVPPEWQQAVNSGAVKDPGPRNLNDPTWVHRYQEYIASLPVKIHSTGSESGINSEG